MRDVAIQNGRIAAVAARIDPALATQTVSIRGLYIMPGLIDIHVHVLPAPVNAAPLQATTACTPTGSRSAPESRRSPTRDVPAGGISRISNNGLSIAHKTRVLAFLNIVGNGMRGPKFENDLADMEVKPAADMAAKHKGLIVGIKTAHYAGPEWTPVEHAVEAATLANIAVMVDFGANLSQRPITELVTKKLRPGDIYTHVYSGLRNELVSGQVNPALFEARKRGVIFGDGNGSFAWRIAVPAIKEGFPPDSISTDLHIGSMNSGMQDMTNVMSKFLSLGLSLEDVVAQSTWNPAREIRHEELGNLSVGSPADIAASLGWIGRRCPRLTTSERPADR